MTAVLAARERTTRTVLIVGLVLLWMSGLISTLLEFGDCGGSAETCAAAATVARDHVRLLVVVLLAITVIAVVAVRTRRPWADAALLASAAVVALAGLWAGVAGSGTPAWLPAGFLFTIPAALVLLAGAARRFVRATGTRES